MLARLLLGVGKTRVSRHHRPRGEVRSRYTALDGTPFSCDQASCGAGTLQGRGNGNYEIQTRLQFWF